MGAMLRYPSQADVAQVVAHLIGNEEVTSPSLVISSFFFGGVAQLGERTVRIRKVEGSNPFVSIEGETSQHSESLVK